MSLTLKELIKIGQTQLEEAGVADAAIDAKELYCFMMGYDKVALMMHWQNVLQDNQCEVYFDLVQRRAQRTPLQHITGAQEFMGLSFKVNENVLIPRQDTETMVEDAIELVAKGTLRQNAYLKDKTMKPAAEILDLCCGSGAIGISLASRLPKAKVTCSDISGEALEIARKNASQNGCRVKFIQSNLFESKAFAGTLGKKKFDLIISNPPYIESKEIDVLEPEVRDHEPRLALDGGEDGLDFYRIIASEAAAHLKKNGCLMLEIGYNQKDSVKDILRQTGAYDKIIGLSDLTGKDRIVVASLKTEEKTRG